MTRSLSSLSDNFVEGFHNVKCKDFKSCLEYIRVKYKLLILSVSIKNTLSKP